jgi:hypothetical protein
MEVKTMQMDLSQEEFDFLGELLEYESANLREEVYKTEGTDWKHALKDREHLLAGLLAKFQRG